MSAKGYSTNPHETHVNETTERFRKEARGILRRRACEECGAEYHAARSTARFCSDACSQRFRRSEARSALSPTGNHEIACAQISEKSDPDRKEVMLVEPSIPAVFRASLLPQKTAEHWKPLRQSVDYPDRPYPLQSGPKQDRWVRELCGSIVSRQAPILLDRRDVELALDLSSATFDRRMRDGKLSLENMVMQGDRELYRREQVRAILLSAAGVVA